MWQFPVCFVCYSSGVRTHFEDGYHCICTFMVLGNVYIWVWVHCVPICLFVHTTHSIWLLKLNLLKKKVFCVCTHNVYIWVHCVPICLFVHTTYRLWLLKAETIKKHCFLCMYPQSTLTEPSRMTGYERFHSKLWLFAAHDLWLNTIPCITGILLVLIGQILKYSVFTHKWHKWL